MSARNEVNAAKLSLQDSGVEWTAFPGLARSPRNLKITFQKSTLLLGILIFLENRIGPGTHWVKFALSKISRETLWCSDAFRIYFWIKPFFQKKEVLEHPGPWQFLHLFLWWWQFLLHTMDGKLHLFFFTGVAISHSDQKTGSTG